MYIIKDSKSIAAEWRMVLAWAIHKQSAQITMDARDHHSNTKTYIGQAA